MHSFNPSKMRVKEVCFKCESIRTKKRERMTADKDINKTLENGSDSQLNTEKAGTKQS